MNSSRPEPKLDIAPSLRRPFAEGVRGWVVGALAAGLLIELVSGVFPLGGLIGFILAFLVWLVVYRVASEILLIAADGETTAGASRFQASDGLAARHVGLWVIATLALAVPAIYFGTGGAILGSIAIAAVLPAATIVLTLSRSLVEALLPSQWFRLIVRIGYADYGRLCGVLLAAALAYLALSGALVRLGASPLIRQPLILAYWAAAVLAWFHLAGRAVYMHRVELGLDENDIEIERAPERFSRDPEALWTEVTRRGGSEAMHAELARWLDRAGDRQRQFQHARQHIGALLLAFEKSGAALDRAEKMLEIDPTFALEQADAMFTLVLAAFDSDRPRLTLDLAQSYLHAFPSSVKGNEVRLLACEALAGAPRAQQAPADQWFRQLMTAELAERQRQRLNVLAKHYL